jgi:hypothetical protein
VNKNLSRQIVFAAVILLALGCAGGRSMPEGILSLASSTPLKREQAAYIFSDGPFGFGVLNVDGVKISNEVTLCVFPKRVEDFPYRGIIELKPGTHTLTVKYSMFSGNVRKYSEPITSTVDVKAGRLYKFAAEISKEGNFWSWKGKQEILSDFKLEDVTGQMEYESRFNQPNILPRTYK